MIYPVKKGKIFSQYYIDCRLFQYLDFYIEEIINERIINNS